MKIIILSGSPRKKGHTAGVVKELMERLGQDAQVENIHVVDKKIKPCLGCDVCHKHPDKPGCVHRDDFESIYAKMAQADWIIYASPVYVWGFTAQIKPLLDRHYCLVKWGSRPRKLLQGKKSLLITTCGGEKENNADLISKIYGRQADYLGLDVKGVFVVDDFDNPRENRRNVAAAAESMARLITN